MLPSFLLASLLSPAASPISARDREFWSFRTPVRPAVPAVRSPGGRTPVDAFLLAKLEKKGLTFAPEADRATLARRLSLDLCGLPPTPEEVEEFENDTLPGAWERLVDRMLASPHFGERWARHWLDAAGYADTVGPDNDADIIRVRDELWRYRDYAIDSLNRNKPFDRFVLEQVAGDELVDWRKAERFTPQIREALIATGFLRTAVDGTLENELNRPLERWQVLHDTLDKVGTGLLGLTLSCARCHDHKFDPISQKDYYRLMAFFTPSYNPSAWVQPQNRHLDDISAQERVALDKRNAELEHQAGSLDERVRALRQPVEERLRAAKLNGLPAVLRDDVRTALAAPAGTRTEVQRYLADKLGPLVAVSPAEVDAALPEAERARQAAWREEAKRQRAGKRTPGKIQALVETGPPPPTYLFRRGDHQRPGPEVRPGFPEVLTPPGSEGDIAPPEKGASSSGRRLALARWLADAKNPLVARVFVNRVWQHLFGQGLVGTPDNFGRSGLRPTHPELLDWLATEFVRSGWSVKRLVRLIVTSAAYRQSTRPEADRADPGNELLGRMRLRRVEAEVLRDSLLAVSGRLERSMGGPPVPVQARKDGLVVVRGPDRRSIYLLTRRNYQPTLLALFDQPVMAVNCTRRTSSAVPLQSLTLLNDDFVVEQGKAFAARVVREAPPEKRVERAFRLALARRPSREEEGSALALVKRQEGRFRAAGLAAEAELRAWAQLCQMLLCTNEFLYAP